MTTTTQPTAVAEFAARVREALSDLPPDELDEITDGLVADLTERAAESGDPDLGDPLAYAEELRAAAGYPPRDARSHRGAALPDLNRMTRGLRARWDELVQHPFAAGVVAFFVSLRPVWWVFRGWAIGMLISGWAFSNNQVLPQSGSQWLLILAVVVVSVQFGRGKWLPKQWMRRAMIAVNVAMVLATPFVIGWATSSVQTMQNVYDDGSMDTMYSAGLTQNGTQIDNIFAYDENGDPIDRVQLFDQDGRPLDLTTTDEQFWGTMNGQMVVPSVDVPGRAGWNVYPLDQASWNAYDDDMWISEDETFPSEWPNVHVKPLANPTVDTQEMSEGGPLAGAEVEPTPGATPAP